MPEVTERAAPAQGAPPARASGPVGQIWRLAGPRRARLARGVAWRFLQTMCLGIPFGAVVVLVDALRDGPLEQAQVWQLLALVAASLVGQLVFGYLSVSDTWLSAFALVGDLRLAALEHLRRLPMSFHLGRQQGETVTALTADMAAVEGFASDGLAKIAQALGLPVVVLLFLSFVDPRLAAATALSVVVAIPVYLWSNRRLAALGIVRQDRQAATASRVIEYVQGLAVIRAFNRGDVGERHIRQAAEEFRAISNQLVVALTPPMLGFAAVVQLGVPVVVAVSGYAVLGGRVDVSTGVVFLVLSLSVYAPLLAMLDVMEDLRLAEASLRRIARVMDAPVAADPVVHAEPQGSGVTFDHVGFGYVAGTPVLHDVSFVVPARSMTAIVGPSGSGKSTLLGLVARFHEAQEGAVRIGGVDVRELSAEQVYSRITVVFQDVYLFQGTVADNIAMGREGATEAEVQEAARTAHAHEFISALPDGYATRVGEGGAALSGGERQRISIARALLKDAPIVLLDEATASVDPTNEKLIQQALAALVADRTLLVVAHKLATIRAADQIVAVRAGRVVERGTHTELLANGGLYADFLAQRERAHSWRLRTDGSP